MDKFTDWKRYVQEETDKAKQDGRVKDDVKPPRQVPSYDSNRYRIKRNKDVAEEREKGKTDTQDKTGGDRVVADKTGSTGPGSLMSPFVSVQQVWDAAERTNRSRKSIKMEDTALKQRKLPGIQRVSPEPSGTLYTQGRSSHEESREELLERLVNPTITLEEASKIMGVCKATVRRYTAKGILPHYRTPGNQRRFKLNDVINFLEEQRR